MPQTHHLRPGLPAEARKLGGRLFNQQCWCWGCDIRQSENLLLRYGFTRHRVPAQQHGSSAYTLRENAATVIVWGWGLWYSDGGSASLYLPRHTLRPGLMAVEAAPSNVWSLNDLPSYQLPRSGHEWARVRELLGQSCRWIGRYETWVAEASGVGYRAECVARWHKNPIAAEEMAAQWQTLAEIAA